MTLEKRTVNLAITGGVNERVDPRVAVSPIVMKNCRYTKTGTVSKRSGTVCIGLYSARYNSSVAPTTAPPTAQLLTTRGDELIRVGSGELDTITQSTFATAGSKDSIFRSSVPQCVLRKTGRVGGVLTAGDSANYGSFIATVYPYQAPGSSTTTIYLDLFDSATDSMLMRRVEVVSGSTVGVTCKVAAVLDAIIVAYVEGTNLKYKYVDLDTAGSPPSLSAATTITTCVSATQMMDMDATPAVSPGGGIPGFYVYTIVVGNAGADVKVSCNDSGGGAATTSIAKNEIDTVAIRSYNGDTYYYVMYANYTGGAETVYGRRFTPGGATAAAAEFSMLASAPNPNRMQSAIGRLSNTSHVFVWSDNVTDTVYWDKRDNSDAAQFSGTTRQMGAAGASSTNSPLTLAGQPFLMGTKLYAPVQTVPFALAANVSASPAIAATGQQRTTATLIDLMAEDNSATNSTGRIVATALPGQCYRADLYHGIPKTMLLDSSTAAFNAATADVSSATQTADLIRLTADFGWDPVQAVMANDSCVLAGGMPHVYDGVTAVECGFLSAPHVANTTQSTSGSLTQLATYSYCAIFAWPDANGLFHFSPPSNVVTVTLTGTNDDITNTVTCLHATNKKTTVSGAAVNTVQIWLYRTLANGSTFYRLGSYASTVNGAVVSVLDTTLDTDLDDSPLLYTTGNVLESQAPPSAGYVFRALDRIWLVDTDDGSVWFSDTIVAGEAPRFNTLWTLPPPKDGRYVAGAQLDANVVLFTRDSIDLVFGDGPDSTGAGSFGQRYRIASDVGCSEPRSVSQQTPWGLFFQSRYGLCMLDRSQQVHRIGVAVEDSAGATQSTPYSIVAAVNTPDKSEVWFPVDVTGTQRAVVYDILESPDPANPDSLQPVWYTDEYTDPVGATPKIVSGCYWNGRRTWINSSGRVYQDLPTTYLDTASGYTSAWVTLTLQTSHWNSQGLASWMSVFGAGALLEYLTDHNVTISVYEDWATSSPQTGAWTHTEVTAARSGTREQLMVQLAQQKAQAVSVKITDATPTSGTVGTGQGFRASGITLEVGPRAGMVRLPAAARK